MIVLGIDPGTVKCGIALYNSDNNSVIFNDVISFKNVKDGYLERQLGITHGINMLVDKYMENGKKIEYVGIEDQYFRSNIQQAIKLSRMTGMLVYMLYEHYDIIPIFISPKKATKSLGIDESVFRNKRNKKKIFHEHVVKRVSELFNIELKDTDDAFAVAIAVATYKIVSESEASSLGIAEEN